MTPSGTRLDMAAGFNRYSRIIHPVTPVYMIFFGGSRHLLADIRALWQFAPDKRVRRLWKFLKAAA